VTDAPVDSTAPAPAPPSAAPGAAGPARRWSLIAGYVLGTALAAGLGWLLLLQIDKEAEADPAREDVLRAARQSALNLTSIDNENFDTDVKNVLEGSTGAFRTDFEARSKDLKKVLEENEVVSEGKVIEAAIVRADSRTATALVVVDSNVKNTAVPDGRVNTYRMKLELENQDGTWRTSMLEFVG
jgi:Mce-associated membrane protein